MNNLYFVVVVYLPELLFYFYSFLLLHIQLHRHHQNQMMKLHDIQFF